MLQGLPNINIDDDASFWQSLVDVAFHNSYVNVKRTHGFNASALAVPFEERRNWDKRKGWRTDILFS